MIVLKIFLTAAFLFVGGAKLFKAKPLKDQFEEFGLPGNYILLIGGLEVLGAIGIQIPMLSLFAAIGLQGLLFGAIANHYKTKHPLMSYAPAIVLSIGLIVFIGLTVVNTYL